jgi:nuclear pore complex protein Nup98-Nup96
LKLSRIPNKDSVVKDSEAAYEDAGLSLGKAFRAGWGAGGQLAFRGKLASPHEDM